jgi:putative nucleotidyltransferase with HDIG domain
VIEIFHRARFTAEEDVLEFLEAMAGQAAIAIDNATLFAEMQQSHQELSQAYEATLEGWARALELRDFETKGHCTRVTDLTLQLARALGVEEKDLAHIYRGALLHDIGKIAVPDAILFKAGPLTPEEWVIMRQHPIFAHELLTPIAYLRPAVAIPFCHHERWDGSGYPMGLKGEDIPLAARIFMVVDVWDALGSDRPYRRAWPPDKIKAYLREQADKQFDPGIVQVFLEKVLP